MAWVFDSNPDPVAGANGGFEYSVTISSGFVATYSVTAVGTMSGTATTMFTDAIQNDIEQWANDAPQKFQTGDLNDQKLDVSGGWGCSFPDEVHRDRGLHGASSGVAFTHTAVIQHDVTGGPAVIMTSWRAMTRHERKSLLRSAIGQPLLR